MRSAEVAVILPAVLASLVWGHCQKGLRGGRLGLGLRWGWDHEGEEADEDCGDLPGWIPFLGMEVGKGKAKAGIRLEAAWN
jgi:hypothetical protein